MWIGFALLVLICGVMYYLRVRNVKGKTNIFMRYRGFVLALVLAVILPLLGTVCYDREYGAIEWHLIKKNVKKFSVELRKMVSAISDKSELPTVSFCITYRDRFAQISKTLPKNLADNRADKDKVDFILVDFDPKDTTLKNYIFKNFAEDIKSGFLKYYQTDKMPKWNFPVAKNTSHYYADNDIVVNLDADNYTGPQGGLYVARILQYNPGSVLWQKGRVGDGSYGRIALYKKDFDYLGGYDEALPAPASHQDLDIIYRARAYFSVVKRDFYNDAIANSKDDTIRHTGSSLSYNQMVNLNVKYTKERNKKLITRVNNGTYGIRDAKRITEFTDGTAQ